MARCSHGVLPECVWVRIHCFLPPIPPLLRCVDSFLCACLDGVTLNGVLTHLLPRLRAACGTLRMLTLTTTEHIPPSVAMGCVSGLAAATQLRHLVCTGRGTGALAGGVLRHMAAGRWPRLHRLHLGCCGTLAVTLLPAALRGCTQLRALGLRCSKRGLLCRHARDIGSALGALTELEELDLAFAYPVAEPGALITG